MTAAAGRAAALGALGASGVAYETLFRHGSLAVEFYAPPGADRQSPHARDEIYVVATGSGTFVCDGAPQPVEPGEVLFVAAGVSHHFEAFTDDFGTWVFFYGPVGGEGEPAHIRRTYDPRALRPRCRAPPDSMILAPSVLAAEPRLTR